MAGNGTLIKLTVLKIFFNHFLFVCILEKSISNEKDIDDTFLILEKVRPCKMWDCQIHLSFRLRYSQKIHLAKQELF